MARYIDADKFLKKNEPPMCSDDLYEALYEEPAADVEVVRHGHWINIGFEEYWCSVCDANGEDVLNKRGNPNWKCCPHCGAKMEGGKDKR